MTDDDSGSDSDITTITVQNVEPTFITLNSNAEIPGNVLPGDPVVITVEENVKSGGFGSAVIEYMVEKGYDTTRVRNLAVPDRYMEHAPRGDLLDEAGLLPEQLVDNVVAEIEATAKGLIKSLGKSA